MTLPLNQQFPGTSALPRVHMCDLPTPVDRLDWASLHSGGESDPSPRGLWVKRDDLTNPAYGGNKVRKLEFLLGAAIAEKRRAVVTFGAYGSNHALATAVHARALGLEPHVVLSPQEPGPFAARTLLAHAGLGTIIHPVEGWDGLRAAVAIRRELTQRDGVEPSVIPMGGTSALGAIGYVNAALEALGQFLTEPPDIVYVAGGTLGTAIGLAIGFAAAGGKTRTIAVRVTPGEVASNEFAEKITSETISLLRSLDSRFPDLTLEELAFEMRDDWFEPGYGVVTPEATDAVAEAAANGIHLETTYTGKAFAALLADARVDGLAGRNVLFWDTYNSAPYPRAGAVELLPPELQEYVHECERQFGSMTAGVPDEGDSE